MKTTYKLLPICFLTLVFAACDSGGEDPQPTTTGTVSGTVSAAADQSPVADAVVTIGSKNTTSIADGSFELSNVPTGSVEIRAEAAGFDIYTENVQVQEGLNNHNILLNKSIYESDPFTMYLPLEIEEVRGVIFFLTGGDGDGRPWIRGDLNLPFEALAGRQLIKEIMDTYSLAFMGNDNSHYANPDRLQAMLSALEDFAEASGHPELAYAPLLPFGFSRGGSTALNFAMHSPERTIGVYSYKGTNSIADPNWEIINDIPVFLHMGELDTEAGSSIPPQFQPNREAGAPWAAGIEIGVGHDFDPPMAFMTAWMEELIISRIPDAVTPGTIPALNVIAEESGWVGDLNTFEIMPFAEFQGDPGSASWLPNQETAQDWSSFFQ